MSQIKPWLSSGTSGLMFGISFQLDLYYIFASNKGSVETVLYFSQMQASLRLLTKGVSSKNLFSGSNVFQILFELANPLICHS